MIIKLTTEQKNRLKAASSGVYGDLRDKMTDDHVDATSKKIDEVLFELHNEAPEAFTTFAYKNQQGRVMFSKLSQY
jgi:hypothetical protein